MVAFLVTRAAALLAGMRYSTVTFWQLLDFDILHHRLLPGLLHLHAQPPLYNAIVGAAEKLGGAHFGNLMLALQLALGLGAAISAYLTLVCLDLSPSFSFIVGLLLLLNPAAVEYEFDPLYTELVYSLHCFIALALSLYLRNRTRRSLSWLIGLMVCLTLVRASYQWVWLAALVAVLSWQLPESRRQLRNAGLAGVLLTLLWPAKNFVLFHHFASTTWAPYSMAKHWDLHRDKQPLQDWIREGKLPTFTAPPFTSEADLDAWLQSHEFVPPTGAPELDDIAKRTSEGTNWNSLAMLRMLDDQAKDVSFLLRHDPKTYAAGVVEAVNFYFKPSTMYLARASDTSNVQYRHMARVDTAVRRLCCNVFGFPNQPSGHGSLRAIVQGTCMGAVLAFCLMLACVLSTVRPSLWNGNPNRKAFILVAGTTVAYGFLVSSLMEIGENMRFRFETHALVIMVCAVFLQQLGDRLAARRSALSEAAAPATASPSPTPHTKSAAPS